MTSMNNTPPHELGRNQFDIRSMLVSDLIAKPESVTYFEELTSNLRKVLARSSLSRKILKASDAEQTFDDQVNVKLYLKEYANLGSNYDICDSIYQTILCHLLKLEERCVVKQIMKHAPVEITDTFENIWKHVTLQPQHAAHAFGRFAWSTMVDHDDIGSIYMNNDKADHNLVLDGQFGWFVFDNEKSPLYSDMLRLAELRCMDNDTYLHFKELPGTYKPFDFELNLTTVGNEPVLELHHEFKYTLDVSGVTKYTILSNNR